MSLNWIDDMLDIILKFVFVMVFVFIITPLGLILRLVGVDYLSKRIDENIKSYWFKR